MNRRYSLMYLAFIGLVASVLACNAPTPTAPAPQAPPPTVTPYIPATSPSQETPPPPATEAPPEATLPSAPPEVTDAAPTSTPEAATESPPPAPAATNTPTPTATLTPTIPVSTGPLDFEAPYSIYSWEPLPGGQNKVVIRIPITGGAPPFTVSHGPNVDGQTMEREYFIEFSWGGCSGIVQSITVESADGQSVKKDYWIGTEYQPWCP